MARHSSITELRKKPVPHSRSVVRSIYRYPVEGFSPQKLNRSILMPGKTIAGDRMFAIENGSSGFDAQSPAHIPKTRFLNAMQNERVAAMKTTFDDASHILTIQFHDRELARGDLRTTEGRATIEEFITRHFGRELRGPPKIVSAAGHSFSDVGENVVSIINLASVSALQKELGIPVDPIRFRGNIYVDGWPPWHEATLVGRELALGPTACVRVVARISRCAATNVDPESGVRNLNVPATLMRMFGHVECGIYASVTEAGEVAPEDRVETRPKLQLNVSRP
jgi:uncharacterized protein YcbX